MIIRVREGYYINPDHFTEIRFAGAAISMEHPTRGLTVVPDPDGTVAQQIEDMFEQTAMGWRRKEQS